MLDKIINFIKVDIWNIKRDRLSPLKSFLLNQARIILVTLRGFGEDNCYFHASALTFYTLLSIVPVVAMLFGFARGFGVEKILADNIQQRLQGNEEVADRIIGFSQSLLENTESGVIVGVGILLLFWTVIKLFGHIELSFNEIWGIKQPRTILRKITDYLTLMFIAPICLVSSSSLTVMLRTKVSSIYIFDNPMVHLLLKSTSFITLWLFFWLIYLFMPNTRVKAIPGLIGGIVAGTLFQILQFAYVDLQVFTSKYNAIYGSFAAIPLFLVWLQMSWVILLLGAEAAFAVQNVDTYEFEIDALHVSYSLQKVLALFIMKLIVERFSNGEPPITAEELSKQMDTPVRLVRQILYYLSEAHLINEIQTANTKLIAFQPALCVSRITIQKVIEDLENVGHRDIPATSDDRLKGIRDKVVAMHDMIRTSPLNLRIDQL